MNKDRYTIYLETIILSLLYERKSQDDIKIVDPNTIASLTGSSVSVFNLKQLIEKSRESRD